jgi:uncharacterized protein DUF3606
MIRPRLAPDRSRVAGDQDYEVRYVAEKYGLSVDQVKKLIARVGNDREKIEAAARQVSPDFVARAWRVG